MLADLLVEILTHRNRHKQESSKKVIAATVIGTTAGIAIGVAAGLLLAPKSGKETRSDIKNAVINTAGDMKDNADMIYSKVNKAIDDAKESFGKLKEKMQREHSYFDTCCEEHADAILENAEDEDAGLNVIVEEKKKPARKKV
jgi:gas vesicle protein